MQNIAIVNWNYALIQHPFHLVYIALSQQDIEPFFHLVLVCQLSLYLFLNQNSSIVVGTFPYPSEGLNDIWDVIELSFSMFVNRVIYSFGMSTSSGYMVFIRCNTLLSLE